MTRRKEFTIVEEGELTEVAKALIEFAGEEKAKWERGRLLSSGTSVQSWE